MDPVRYQPDGVGPGRRPMARTLRGCDLLEAASRRTAVARPETNSPISRRRTGIDAWDDAKSHAGWGRNTTEHVKEDGWTRWRRCHNDTLGSEGPT